MKIRKITDKQELYSWLNFISREYGRKGRNILSDFERKFLGEIRVGVLYNCSYVVLVDPEITGEIVSVFAYTITGGYLNIYFVLSHPEYRRNGASKMLIDYILSEESDRIVRMYVKASSIESVIMFWNMGFTYYGTDSSGVLVGEKDVARTKIDLKRKSIKMCVMPRDLSYQRTIGAVLADIRGAYNCPTDRLLGLPVTLVKHIL